jgi:hypothetical protein
MSPRLSIDDLGKPAAEEIRRAIILFAWIPLTIAVIVLIISIDLDRGPFGMQFGHHHWTMRSGSIMAMLGVFVGFVDAKLTSRFNPIDASNAGRLELPFKYFAIGLALCGTFVWGYADLWL